MIPLYLPETKKKKNKKRGKLIDPKTGLAFLGPFFMDYLGRFFKGKNLNKNSEPLIFIPDEPEKDTKGEFFNRFPKPSDKDYKKGRLLRYFVKDVPTGKVAELDKESYNVQVKENLPYRKFFTIDWHVTGEAEDSVVNGYIAEGVKTKNQRALEAAERQFPGIGNVLTDPTEYNNKEIADSVVDRSGAKPVDNLQTKPNQYTLEGGIPYNGPYHIHPTLGPMVGSMHTSGEHPKLSYIGSIETMPPELKNQIEFSTSGSVINQNQTYDGYTLVRSS